MNMPQKIKKIEIKEKMKVVRWYEYLFLSLLVAITVGSIALYYLERYFAYNVIDHKITVSLIVIGTFLLLVWFVFGILILRKNTHISKKIDLKAQGKIDKIKGLLRKQRPIK